MKNSQQNFLPLHVHVATPWQKIDPRLDDACSEVSGLIQLFRSYNVRETTSLALVSVKQVTHLLFQILLNNSRDSFNRF